MLKATEKEKINYIQRNKEGWQEVFHLEPCQVEDCGARALNTQGGKSNNLEFYIQQRQN